MLTNEQIQKMLFALLDDQERKLRGFYDSLDYSKPYECKKAIMLYVPEVIYQTQVACATLSAYVYRELREGIDDGFKPQPVIPSTKEEIAKEIEYDCKYLFGEDDDIQKTTRKNN